MATTITATDVITAFGAHYIDNGQNQQHLLMRPFEAFGTREAFTNVPTKDTQLRFSDVTISEVLQPYQDQYTPKGGTTFKPVTISLQPVKIDQLFNPTNLFYSWLGFLTSVNNDRKTWPFIRWFIEEYLVKRVQEDLEKQVIYKGVKADVTAGTAGAAADVMDGVKKIINTAITATAITPIPTGALSTDPVTFCNQVEAFVKAIPELFWDKTMVLNMNRSLALRFAEGKKAKYNMYYAQDSDLAKVANFPNISVKGRASMNNSAKIWMTPIENAVFATKGFENASGFQLESVDRNVKIWGDFHIGAGFLQPDLVFTNNQDLT